MSPTRTTLPIVTDAREVVTIDGGDLGCARLLLLLRDRVATLPAGTVVHLVTADPVAPIDLPVWCHMTGHTYLGVVGGVDRPTYAVAVAARPAATDARNPWRRGPGAS
ncbi:sulfurtransferase TusA family protein [Cellulomonas sp. zg-ZUI40]|nr:sulfurtransferase TusA family protein [Cellulomonas dongxiuzhuiae]